MKVYKTIKGFNVKKTILTVGTFDGVHLGHKKILNKLVQIAKESGGEAVVFTLHPHPRKVLFPNTNNLFFLNTIEEKTKLLEKIGIKHFIIHTFTKDFANLSSCNFIEEVLFKQLKIKKLIVGYDHRFGKDKQGDFNKLNKCALKYGIELIKIDALIKNEVTISSTKIRNELLAGNIQKANSYLSYNYNISGKVVSGNKIGRKIGFPTANIEVVASKIIPANGVYAVNVLIEETSYNAMLNIGTRPTIDDSNKTVIEVHLFDFEQDIYGAIVKIEFLKFVRTEIKFNDISDLKKQLIEDKKEIESYFM